MMNKIKYLFLMTVFAALVGSALNVSAQSNPQVDKVAQYYEWLFETQFTSAQRTRYQEIKAADLRNDPAGERKGMEGLLNNFSTIKSKSESEQVKVRGIVMNTFINDLRGMGSDNQEAQFLLSVYDGAQAKIEQDAKANGAGNIAAIAGKWAWGHTITNTYAGAMYAGSTASRFTYQFSPGGAVEFTGIMNIMQGTCSQQVFQNRKGQASLNGDTLTILWQPETYTRDFSCDRGGNYTKKLPAKTEKVKISLKNDSGRKQLCFIGAECFDIASK